MSALNLEIAPARAATHRPRVLLLATYSQALSAFIAPLARYLEEHGYEVLMGASEEALVGPSTLPSLRAQNFDVVGIPFTNRPLPHRDLQSGWRLWRILRQKKFDVVHTFTAKAGFIGRMVARAAGVPVVVHTAFSFPHLDSPEKAWLYRPLERKTTSLSDHVFCISELGYEQAMALGRSPRHGVSNPGIGLDFSKFATLPDRDAARRDLGLPTGVPLVGAAGRLTPHKRIGMFLEICRAVGEVRPDAQFVVLGDGPERERLDALAARLGIAGRVHFIRFVPHVMTFHRALDVFALPTEREGFGMVFAEAMACETAAVGPDMPPVNDIITPDSGVLVGRDDTAAWTAAIVRLLADDRLRLELGRRGRDRIRTRFDERIAFAMIEKTYRDLLAKR
jgi:glycosyltransferase involved in cell wall biosynthesis